DARSVLHDRLSLRRDLSRRGIPWRSGTAGPGDRTARERAEGAAAEVAIHAGPRVRLLLAPSGLSDGGVLVPEGGRGARRPVLDGAARSGDAGGRRQAKRVARALAANREIRGALAARLRGPAAAAARRHGRDGCARRARALLSAAISGDAALVGCVARRRLH